MRVVVVGMFDSIHFARWLSLFRGSRITFYLFPSSPHRRVHPKLRSLLTHSSGQFKAFPFSRVLAIPMWVLAKVGLRTIPAVLLGLFIRAVRPDGVHAIELQNAGYLTRLSLAIFRMDQLPLIITNYGSDIFWFWKFSRHRTQLRALLERADFYSAECDRDVELARAGGFEGAVMPVMPNAGGIDKVQSESKPWSPASRRTVIAVKGYQGWAGEARVALLALAKIHGEIRDYDVVVFSASRATQKLAKELAKQYPLSITCYPKNSLSHREVLGLFGKSLVYIGISKTDGISTSLLEAMSQGAIPVQSSTSCASEWLHEGGVFVEGFDVHSIAAAITQGLYLAKHSTYPSRNPALVRDRFSKSALEKLTADYYEVLR